MNRQKYTNEHIIEALERCDGLVFVAAKMIGCSASTVHKRIETVKAVRRAVDECRGRFVDHAEGKLHQSVLAGDPWAVQFTLKTLGKHRGYVERQEIAGVEGEPLIIEIVRRETAD